MVSLFTAMKRVWKNEYIPQELFALVKNLPNCCLIASTGRHQKFVDSGKQTIKRTARSRTWFQASKRRCSPPFKWIQVLVVPQHRIKQSATFESRGATQNSTAATNYKRKVLRPSFSMSWFLATMEPRAIIISSPSLTASIFCSQSLYNVYHVALRIEVLLENKTD